LGRVVVSLGAVPAVFPVNYYAEGGAIYFLTGAGTKLTAALRGAVVSFEVDEVDRDSRRGWSVLAVGPATVVEDDTTKGAVLANQLRPWAPGERHVLVRIWPDLVTGRRIS
jgi:nitroimidazol reductase NimA-like FMN-containing flavoprotein (pyridoxamine 5'-phosphate oxidase superfamily)